jgi:hypothetical protein
VQKLFYIADVNDNLWLLDWQTWHLQCPLKTKLKQGVSFI